MTTKIEKLSTRRRMLLMFMASAFLAWQVPAMDFVAELAKGSMRLVDGIALFGALAWIIAALALVFTQRKYRRLSANESAVLEDDLVQANRSKAMKIGYGAMMLASVLMFIMGLRTQMFAAEAAHIILVVGVVTPMYAFAYLERANA